MYNSAVHCPIDLKFSRLAYYGSAEVARELKPRMTAARAAFSGSEVLTATISSLRSYFTYVVLFVS